MPTVKIKLIRTAPSSGGGNPGKPQYKIIEQDESLPLPGYPYAGVEIVPDDTPVTTDWADVTAEGE